MEGEPRNDTDRELKVSDLIGQERQCNEAVVREKVSPEDDEYILFMSIPSVWGNDRFMWPYTKNRTTQACSVYRRLWELDDRPEENASSNPQNNIIWRDIWVTKALPKVNNYMWRLAANAIVINHNLNRRGMDVNPRCLV